MELKDFVSNTITQIAEGIAQAQTTVSGGVVIAPPINEKGMVVLSTRDAEKASSIDFDIAVNIEEKQHGETQSGSLSIKVVAVELSASSNASDFTDKNTSTLSRIKFSIPVVWSCGK